jgi:anti-anti-sigma regulatory factor
MEIKIDTKEKFTVLSPLLPDLSANIAASIKDISMSQLALDPKNIILQMQHVENIEAVAAFQLAELQAYFYENSASFVICNLTDSAEKLFEKLELLDFLNTTPTESEAWDIVQMEEIEREFLDGEDF